MHTSYITHACEIGISERGRGLGLGCASMARLYTYLSTIHTLVAQQGEQKERTNKNRWMDGLLLDICIHL